MSDAIARLNSALEGRYEVEREIGQGGMATVFLARDVKHNRSVALKVLKPELAAVVGADRFLAEIETTANLQHPHILPLHDSGEADGFLFYVMPFIEGESLRERLDREKQLPVDVAIRLATDVAEALHAAHEQGVIHRDIKPANILMSRGRPLVADFGIALAVSAAGGGRLTETGLSMGTPFYMSPEQASADREPSPASDVYSLGCVLYEMLVGDPPHTGNTAQAVLAKILTERPRSVTMTRATVPSHVAAAVARSLERLPADRFDSAHAFARALADVSFTHEVPGVATTATQTAVTPASPQSPLNKWLPWGVAAVAAALAAGSLMPEPPAPPEPTLRMTLSDFVVERTQGGGERIAISRDGSTIVAGGADDLLYVRRSDDTEFRPIPGTERATHPAISPDGEWLAFSLGGGLSKVQLVGGPVLPVVGEGRDAHWYEQDEIVYWTAESIYTVSSSGGEGRPIAEDPGGGRPFMLPGGRALIHDGPDGLYVRELGAAESTLIATGGSHGLYVPTGHILYGDRAVQSVFAVPFDVGSLTPTGPPVPVLPSVNIFSGGAVQLAVSDNGTLVHGLAVTSSSSEESRLTWIDMEGTRTDLLQVFGFGQVRFPRVSPDGTQVAYRNGESDEVFVYDLNTGEQRQLTFELNAGWPVWSLDGRSLYVSAGGRGWHRVSVDGSSGPDRLPAPSCCVGPMIAISPDGEWGVIEEQVGGEGMPNLLVGRLDTDSFELTPYLRAAWHEEDASVSPDGRWLLYVSSQNDEHAVYIRSFPVPGPEVRVSSEGGGDPVWSPDGRAVYYRFADRMIRRDVRLGERVELGDETDLFSLAGTVTSTQMRMLDIHPEGDRFIVVSWGESAVEQAPERSYEGIGPVVVVVNWFEELRSRMGGSD